MRSLLCIALFAALCGCGQHGNAQKSAAASAAGQPAPPLATPQAAANGQSAPVAGPVQTNSYTEASAPSPVASAEMAPAETNLRAPSPMPPAVRTLAPQQDVARIEIPSGTRIRVRLDQTIDTKRNRAGDAFTASLDTPIVEHGRVVVPTGTEFQGRVVEARESGRFKGRASVELVLDSFRMGGQTWRIATAADYRASRNHKRRNLVLMGGGSGLGATVGAIAGGGVGALIGAGAGAAAGTTAEFITGKKNVRIPVESLLVFRLESPVRVTVPAPAA